MRLVEVARRQGEVDSYVGKRRWRRYALGIRLEVSADPSQPCELWSAYMHDISGGGIGFWSKQPVPIATTLYVRELSERTPAPWLVGRVTYSRLGISGYLVGVEFDAQCLQDAAFAAQDQLDKEPPPPVYWLGPGGQLSSRAQYVCGCMLACITGFGVAAGATECLGAYIGSLGHAYVSAGMASGIAGLICWVFATAQVGFVRALREAVHGMVTGSPVPASLPEAPTRELKALRQSVLDLGSRWRRNEDAERVQRTRLEELNRIKSNILSTVSHDLRTPLTSILLYARMLTEELEELDREDQRRFLGVIADECTRLSRLVDDLLEVQRIEAGRARWEIRAQDLAPTIHRCAGVFEGMALGQSIKFSVDCPKSLPEVEADADRIAQVVSNLLSNALKYTPPGGKVDLIVQARSDDILLRVMDSGPGIPRDKWDQIFDRFTQLGSADSREIVGVGLGLSIVRQIVDRHGGAVWVNSEVGQGSEFFVALPVVGAKARPAATGEASGASGRVVVCDADPELGAMIAQILRTEDFDVQVVHSGTRLIELVVQTQPEVVVTDLALPDMTTVELLEAVESIGSPRFGLVVHTFEGDLRTLRERGVDIVLRRPASGQEMVHAVWAARTIRSGVGRVVVLVKSDNVDLEALQADLTGRGHLCLVADGIRQASELIHSLPVDALLVAGPSLGLGWVDLKTLGIKPEDGVRTIVLCGVIGRNERRLADSRGVVAVRYPSEDDDELASAIMSSREVASGSVNA